MPNILNILDDEGVVKIIPVMLQIDREVMGQSTDKLLR